MSELYETVKSEFLNLRESIRAKLKDGKLGRGEIVTVVREFSAAGVSIVEKLDVPGPERKGIVVEAMMAWWHDPEDGLKKMDAPGPDAILDPIMEELLPGLTGLLVDLLVRDFNLKGWPGS